MTKATWNGTVIAESDHTIEVEGTHYFPRDSVDAQYLQASETHTHCPWKGDASYHHVVVNGEVNQDAAWYYPDPKDAAKEFKDHLGFWRGVEVSQ